MFNYSLIMYRNGVELGHNFIGTFSNIWDAITEARSNGPVEIDFQWVEINELGIACPATGETFVEVGIAA